MKKLLMASVMAAMAVGATALAEDAKPAATAKAAMTASPAKAAATMAPAKATATTAAAATPAATPAAKKEEPKKEAAAASTGEWKVEGKTCKSLTNRECADASESFASTDGTVYAWTKVVGPKEGGELHHVWFKGDDQMGDVTLKIGGSPWRTYSKKTLGDKSQGDWRVEVRDANGAVLETLKFSVK